MTNTVQYRGDVSNRLSSASIWHDCPWLEIKSGTVDGHAFFDDFIEFDPPTIAGEATDKYYGIGDTTATITSLANTDHGAINFNPAAGTDNDQMILVRGFESGFARFGPSDKVWFEGRLSKASIANNALGFFLGFTEPENIGIGDVTLQDNDTDPDLSEDFIGFNCLAADGDVVECIYQEGGGTLVNVGDVNTAIAAATFYKYGFRFDGPAGQLTYYIDGVLAQTLSVTSALAFPDVNHLSMIYTAKIGAGAAVLSQLDWWKCAALTV